MTWTYSDEYYKEYTRETWNESAPNYGPILRNLQQFNGPLFAIAAPGPGDRVLDVATGPGEPALTLAQLVGPDGGVVGIDLAESMIEIAQRRAKARDQSNAEFRVMDAESLEFEDGSFDLVVCRFGLQIVTDPDKVISEALRVLRPGGRFAASVWAQPGEASPAIHALIEPMLEFAEPDETGYLPTPYEMGGPGELTAILEDAGFVGTRQLDATLEQWYAGPDEYFRSMFEGTPIGHSFREEDEATQAKIRPMMEANVAKWTRADGTVVMPSKAVFVGANKPA